MLAVATIEQTNQVQSVEIDEMVLDDLATLSDRIQSLLKLAESGEDATEAYAKVQKLVKGIAVDFGIIKEVLEKNDRLLAEVGLKNQLVAL